MKGKESKQTLKQELSINKVNRVFLLPAVLIGFLFLIYSCENKVMENPLLIEYNTPYEVPPFFLIDSSHFIPAFKHLIKEQQLEIDRILDNHEPPTFYNTIVPFDKSGITLQELLNIYNGLSWASTNKGIRNIAREVKSITTEHEDNIYLNEKLFQRIKSVYMSKDRFDLNKEQLRTLEIYYSDFTRKGANLSDEGKNELRSINQTLAELLIKYETNYFTETNNNFKLVITNKEDLRGLPLNVIHSASQTAKNLDLQNSYVFTLKRSSIIPFLTFSENRYLREKMYKAFIMRCNHQDKYDNNDLFLKIINLRAERAKLLGFKSHADYVISNNMANSPEDVYALLTEVFEASLQILDKEKEELQKIMTRENRDYNLAAWDWWYYAEKLRKEKYNLNESELMPYFSLENVQTGMFYVANKLYGITFTQADNIPVYNSEITTYQVKNRDGSHLGILYTDYYARNNKLSGAWSMEFRSTSYHDDKKSSPVVAIVCNFSKPADSIPTLLSLNEVKIMFHELGHALHSLFSDGKYSRTSGLLPDDMLELPSQIMENWATHPEVLKMYARHYKTGEKIPDNLINKLSKNHTHNQAFALVEYISAALLDIYWYSTQKSLEVNVSEYEQEFLTGINMPVYISPRAKAPYFYQMVAGGYDSNLYDYLWSEILDADAFQAFLDSGDLFNGNMAYKFQKHILTEGGIDEGMVQYIKFRGEKPSIKPMLRKRGLN